MDQSILVVSLNPTIQKTYCYQEGWARGEVNRCGEYHLDASGKGGNCSRVLAQLGAQPGYLTPLGGSQAQWFRRIMESQGVKIHGVELPMEIRSCMTLVDRSKGESTEIVEQGPSLLEEHGQNILEVFQGLLDQYKTLVFIGSPAPGLHQDLYLKMAQEASRKEKFLVLDLNRKDLAKFLEFRPGVIKINSYELLSVFRPELDCKESEIPALQEVIKDLLKNLSRGNEWRWIISQGPLPLLYAENGRLEQLEPPAMEVVNPIGCGDAMTAGLTWGLSRGMTIRQSLELAMDCSRKNGELLRPGYIE